MKFFSIVHHFQLERLKAQLNDAGNGGGSRGGGRGGGRGRHRSFFLVTIVAENICVKGRGRGTYTFRGGRRGRGKKRGGYHVHYNFSNGQ